MPLASLMGIVSRGVWGLVLWGVDSFTCLLRRVSSQQSASRIRFASNIAKREEAKAGMGRVGIWYRAAARRRNISYANIIPSEDLSAATSRSPRLPPPRIRTDGSPVTVLSQQCPVPRHDSTTTAVPDETKPILVPLPSEISILIAVQSTLPLFCSCPSISHHGTKSHRRGRWM
jgi:hypothetical protein